MKKIGGFFPLAVPEGPAPGNLLSLWNIPKYPHWFFSNGRSALHYLLKLRENKTLWLPAYSCTVLAEAVKNTKAKLKFFPIDEELSPTISFLKQHVKKGEAVLAINYFGRNPSAKFLKFIATRPDVDWIEDRAQGLLPAAKEWGDFIIYSPRKLVGVQDGGILVSRKIKLPKFKNSPGLPKNFISPALLRSQDKKEQNNERWYKASVAYENNMKVGDENISKLSRDILANTDVKGVITRRKNNYAALLKGLQEVALLPAGDKNFVPMAFPVKVKDRKKTAKILHAKNIFAAHHWPELPAPKKDFKYEHELAEKMLSIPCDHRYSNRDMEWVAKQVEEAL